MPKAITAAGRAVFTLILIVAALVFLFLAVGPRFLNYQTSTMLTGSMSPGINPGDVVVSVRTPVSELKVGDVITYSIPIDDHRIETHRVASIKRDDAGATSVTTKGDANAGADPWTAVLSEDYVYTQAGVVPYLGDVIRALRQPLDPVSVPLRRVCPAGGRRADGDLAEAQGIRLRGARRANCGRCSGRWSGKTQELTRGVIVEAGHVDKIACRFHRRHPVANAAYRADEPRFAAFVAELLAQVADVHLHEVLLPGPFVAPHLGQQGLPGPHSTRRSGQGLQKIEFRARQFQFDTMKGRHPAFDVDNQRTVPEDAVGMCMPDAGTCGCGRLRTTGGRTRRARRR